MQEIMNTVLMLSLSGTFLAGILFLLRPLYRRRLSKRWQYYIWLVVIARLLVPWSLISVPIEMIHTSFEQPAAESRKPEPSHTTENKIPKELPADAPKQAAASTQAAKPTHHSCIRLQIASAFRKYAPAVWLVTAMMLLLRKLTIYQSFTRYIRAGSRTIDDISLLEHVGGMIGQEHIKGCVGLCTNSLISSPLLIGILKPCIVLPASDQYLTAEVFHYSVLHELIHYKRADLIYKWLIQFTLCLHWFNPFLYLVEREIRQLCELSCDEAVIKNLDAAERKAYGSILLSAMANGTYSSPSASVSFSESKKLLKGRLDAIMDIQKRSKATTAAALALTCLFTAAAASFGTYKTTAAATNRKTEHTAASTERDLTIICENNRLYTIFSDGADEADKPSGGFSEGTIGLTLFTKNGYSTIGPFSHRKKLIKEVNTQCSYALAHGASTQDTYDAFLYTAQEIDRISTTDTDQFPKLNKSSIQLTEGSTLLLKLTRVKQDPVWSSENKKIAIVDKHGTVTAQKPGQTKIYARIGQITYICKVTVTKKQTTKQAYAKAYAAHDIEKKNGAYYYKGSRVRIFMDVKADDSFYIFNYDANGSIDLRLQRDDAGSIIRLESLTQEELNEIQQDLELSEPIKAAAAVTKTDHTKTGSVGSDAKIIRMAKEDAPQAIREALRSCGQGKWYMICKNKKKYIYYNGLAADYAFQPEWNADRLKVKVSDMGRASVCYVLLEVSHSTPVTIYYNEKQVSHKNINL